jgi:predicted small secreted protein
MKLFVALILASTLAACSTVSGLGKDISSAADYTKEKIGGK